MSEELFTTRSIADAIGLTPSTILHHARLLGIEGIKNRKSQSVLFTAAERDKIIVVAATAKRGPKGPHKRKLDAAQTSEVVDG